MKLERDQRDYLKGEVTPYAGVWIETITTSVFVTYALVTPYAGVWIETGIRAIPMTTDVCHSLRGSVD